MLGEQAKISLVARESYHMGYKNCASSDVCVVKLPFIRHRVNADYYNRGNQNC